MVRSGIALAISLVAHILVLLSLSLPAAEADNPGIMHIVLKNPAIANVPDPVQAEDMVEDIFRDFERQQPIREINPSPEIVDDPVESNEGPENIEEAAGNGFTDGQGAFDEGDSEEGTGDGGIGESNELDGGEREADGVSEGDDEEIVTYDLEAIRSEYSRRVLESISAHKVYPMTARRMGREGSVRVRFAVASDGAVSSIEIEASSGVAALDNAARDAVEAASPVPAPPMELAGDSLTLSLLIIFQLD